MTYDPVDGHTEQRRAAMRDCHSPEEFAVAGRAVAEALEAGVPIEVTLCPGNGTRYPLLFVGVAGEASYVSPRDGLESAGAGVGAVWVAVLNGNGTYPLALLGRAEPPAPSYLAEKWFPSQRRISDDVFVFERLLAEVGLRTGIRLVG